MEIKYYPDLTSYVKLGSDKPDSYYKEIIFRINTYTNLMELSQLVDAINHGRGFEPIIIIPNLLDAQGDRRFNKDESSGLKLVCDVLNSMKVKEFRIFHPHNPEVVEALIPNVKIIDNSEFILEVYSDIDKYYKDSKTYRPATVHAHKKITDNLILMSSDAGGFKPLMKLCDKINWKGETYSASKARTKDNMKQLIDRTDFGGKDILIVDDISVYGGTFKGLSNLLKERNCGKLYLAVSHMTVKNLGEDPVTNYFDKVFTTNSKFEEYNYIVDLSSGKMPTDYSPKNLKIIKFF
jgi:ribose-phosphate pyrophosphokinase